MTSRATVVLRSLRAEDEPALTTLFAEPDVRQWNPVARAAAEWWPEANEPSATSLTWAVADPSDDRLLGTVAVFDADRADAEVGYRVLSAESGRGVATAAVLAAVAVAEVRLSLARVRLVHAVDNAASCRVAVKAGFRPERTVPGTEVYGDGRLHDEHLHVYRRLLGPDEFRGTHPPLARPVAPVDWPGLDFRE